MILIGDTRVGTSSLLSRWHRDTFREQHVATQGVNFAHKTIARIGRKLRAELWETAGHPRFSVVVRSYVASMSGKQERRGSVVLVYAVDDRGSFDRIRSHWLPLVVQESAFGHRHAVLLGNKCDLPAARRVVSAAEGEALARQLRVPFFETSAKSGEQVGEALDTALCVAWNEMLRKQHQDGTS